MAGPGVGFLTRIVALEAKVRRLEEALLQSHTIMLLLAGRIVDGPGRRPAAADIVARLTPGGDAHAAATFASITEMLAADEQAAAAALYGGLADVTPERAEQMIRGWGRQPSAEHMERLRALLWVQSLRG